MSEHESPNYGPPGGPPHINDDVILNLISILIRLILDLIISLDSSDIDSSFDECALLIANEHRQKNDEIEAIMNAGYHENYIHEYVKNKQRADTVKKLAMFLPYNLAALCANYVMCKCPGKCKCVKDE
jgi:hypothetical protein